MKAKSYLMQIKKLDVLIENKIQEIDGLRERAESITAPLGGERLQSTSSGDKLERIIVAIIDAENELEESVKKLQDTKRKVVEVIDDLESADDINLIYKRYIRFEPWDKIADEMEYSIQGIFKRHGIALQRIQRKLDTKEEKRDFG